MPKMLKNVIKFICFFGVGVLLIWLFTRNIKADQWDQIKDAFKRANYWLLIPTMTIGVASHWFRAVRWKLLMKPLGHQPTTLNTFFAVMVGYLVNLAVPRLGEVTRCGIIAQYEKVPADKLVGTMIAERAVDLVCLILLAVLTVLTQLELLGSFVNEMIFQKISDKIAHANGIQILMGIVVLVLFIVLFIWLLRRFAKSKVAVTVKSLIRGITEGVLSIGKMERKKKVWFIIHSILIWGCYLSQVYIGFFCLPETSHLGMSAALAVLMIGSVGMIVMPGGIVAYQLLVQATLAVYAIPLTIGFAFGWIIWTAQTVLVLVLGFGSLIALPVYNKKKNAALA
ncbi:MAG: flippase-like domain-containing protein [Chitinophaga sp.]|uniref:lysylphosphatidylglycerol synthase transmembrane domain-containing protein n=1 Tax=Chitinophaga sp. TaxID=1869181 RepID=UPI001B05435B|nr:lysylphosphatidylglycerol synthase transmembrane domain-containing protein [Chitinophaga sp.]MBO9730957.1 flippase-like domain-containing protein [Chitinophaga sp.]